VTHGAYARTGYQFQRTGSFCHYGKYQNPPHAPVMFVLSSGVVLRQAAMGFLLLPEPEAGTTVPYATGHVRSSEVIIMPETGMYQELDVEKDLLLAKVNSAVCYMCIYPCC
jgi:hypothetical protein